VEALLLGLRVQERRGLEGERLAVRPSGSGYFFRFTFRTRGLSHRGLLHPFGIGQWSGLRPSNDGHE
jgi:hypothetical protein